jgi:hypothetical protein
VDGQERLEGRKGHRYGIGGDGRVIWLFAVFARVSELELSRRGVSLGKLLQDFDCKPIERS